jgi:stage II sporulation protein AA (anti-sigma F factor antagonist)
MLDTTLEQTPDGKATITVTGSLTLGTSLSFLDSQVRQLLEGNVHDLTLNLAGVDYADSGGLGLLVHMNGLLKSKQGILRLSGVRPRVMDLLRLTALDTMIAIDGAPASLPPQE